MKRIFQRFRTYWPFAVSEIQMVMSYPANYLMFVFGGIMTTFVTYYLWLAVFKSSPTATLAGFTLQQMIAYVFVSTMTSSLISVGTDQKIAREVRDGSIAMNLIKPIRYRIMYLFKAIGNFLHQFVLIALPLLFILIAVLHLMPGGITAVGLYVFSFSLSFVIQFLFDNLFGLVAFFTINTWGLSVTKNVVVAFFSGAVIPLAFFPEWLQRTLLFFPFGSMVYTPTMFYLGKFAGLQAAAAILTQGLWVVLLGILNHWAWTKAVKRLTILGG